MEDCWEIHKGELQRMFIEKRMTVYQVQEEMEELFNFHASVKQYRCKFKEWGFEKYRTSDDWKIIGYKVTKRDRQGKDTVVSMNGEVITDKKLKKETSRHAFTTLEAFRVDNGTVPNTPEGFSICTPPEIIVLSSDIEDENRDACWEGRLTAAVAALSDQVDAVSQAIHFMVDDIATDYDRCVIGDFARSTGCLVRVLRDQANPFKQILPGDFFLLQSLICLPYLHSLVSYPTGRLQQYRIYHIYETVNQLADRFYARLSRELDLQDSIIVTSLSLGWETFRLGRIGHNSSALTRDSIYIIGTQSRRAQRLQRFVTEFFNHYYRHYFQAYSANFFKESPINLSNKHGLLLFLGGHQGGDFTRAFDGLLQCILQITRLRDRIRERSKCGRPALILREELAVDAVNLDASIRTWKVSDTFTAPGYYLAELYRQSAWAYLYRTVRRPRADEKFQQVVDDGLFCLEQLPYDLRLQKLIAMPLFLLACAAFVERQRKRIEEAFNELVANSGWAETENMCTAIQEIWEVTDTDPASSWDWEKITRSRGATRRPDRRAIGCVAVIQPHIQFKATTPHARSFPYVDPTRLSRTEDTEQRASSNILMDPLSMAASVVALIQVTTSIARSCRRYAKVGSAREDVASLQSEIVQFATIIEKLAELLNGSERAKPSGSNILADIENCLLAPATLDNKLDPGHRQKAVSKLGI
ncbi:fungal-specific transcription factor domain-containing protein [Aspergillus granulosus]|uniref:Fungal-specific transcription factor domain-containing protein n=1 Tax=Aspergillus granulosus TaxID=176169 RepID=A0ABR4H9X7_9EURO